MKTTLTFLFGLTMASDVSAFLSQPTQASLLSSTQLFGENYQGEVSRRGFVETFGMSAAFLAIPKPSWADEVAAEPSGGAAGVSGILQSSNLRSLKRAEKQLSKLEFYAVENEYENMKLALRNAPFSEVRKNSFALIKEFAGAPDQQSKLTASYEVFISTVEKLDSTASLGMRGRKLDNGALLQSYQACSKALGDWIAVATEVAESS
jgi:hypothetical protein